MEVGITEQLSRQSHSTISVKFSINLQKRENKIAQVSYYH